MLSFLPFPFNVRNDFVSTNIIKMIYFLSLNEHFEATK